jgi:hypothetical protein
MDMGDITPEQAAALQVAHDLVDMGAPIFCAHRNTLDGSFMLPSAWPQYRPNHTQVDMWRPGKGLAMVTGQVFDVLDVDPRNGGLDGYRELHEAGAFPRVYGQASTPSEGSHYLIARTGLAKTSKAAKGVDLQAGAAHGKGRGFVWIAPTVRVSKYGAQKGQEVAYVWNMAPTTFGMDTEPDQGMENLREVINLNRGVRRTSAPITVTKEQREDGDVLDLEAFGDVAKDWTAAQADRVIKGQLQAVTAAKEGEINNALGGAARVLGRFVAGGHLSEDAAVDALLEALHDGGVHDDAWNVANGLDWTARTVIGAGLANGAKEPWTVEVAEGAAPATAGVVDSAGTASEVPGVAGAPVARDMAVPPVATVAAPALQVTSAADMAYWLQSQLGAGPLSGFFMREGRIVHTPRVDEIGYVEPKGKDDENGPAQIQGVSAAELAAKIQYMYRCYKEVDEKGEDGKKTGAKKEVAALFPLEGAKRAVDAPEAMSMVRTLSGITHTPMVRADGSILDRPGYDRDSRYLFLPGPGVKVPAVPDAPTAEEVARAVALLDQMTAGFPWDGQEDRVNYYGLLLTPMLRMVTPPAYKMFGITAHQPGSGKTLLADIATALHGGVLRSEVPEDEAEWRKQSTSILAGTSAPVVHLDNVTGVLKSSVLAGLLTADRPLTDRELGSSRMLTTINDRVWVVTGNNLSLGGDLVRRTVLIQIDPNMASPETREFAIADLKGWVREHRNQLLHALLVMIRHWVGQGRPLEARRQSDSYARWQSTVGGILAACGVVGAFDAGSGQKAATGGDDEGLSDVLERIWAMKAGAPWVTAEVLSDTVSGDIGDMVAESRDWLPGVVLDKLARSEAAGRKTFGYWLRNRVGRWVPGSDGHSYVVRAGGRSGGRGQEWLLERSS